jgi:hypothetical protein
LGAFRGGAALPVLGRILRDRGIIVAEQLQEAIQHQVLHGGRLGTSLHELGFTTEEPAREEGRMSEREKELRRRRQRRKKALKERRKVAAAAAQKPGKRS